MRDILFELYRIVVPKPIRTVILKNSLRIRILTYFSSLPEAEVNDEHRKVLDYLRKNPVSIFPYEFQQNYDPDDIEVIYDPEKKLRYVMYEGKRLYFRRGWGTARIKRAWNELLKEQDPDSPHRYLVQDFGPKPGGIVADIGAAEGNFTLSVIEKTGKAYLFETNRRWIEALKATFEPWKDKVEIINSCVSDHNDESHISLDNFFEHREYPDFIKIDVEGAEDTVLRSCSSILQSGRPLRLALCTYHRNVDEKLFTVMLGNAGFTVTPSKGYMINYYDKKLSEPFLRRGLIRASR